MQLGRLWAAVKLLLSLSDVPSLDQVASSIASTSLLSLVWFALTFFVHLSINNATNDAYQNLARKITLKWMMQGC